MAACGTLTLNNSIVSGNNSPNGGGIYNDFGYLTLSQSVVSGNRSQTGGGIENYFGAASLQDSTIAGNSASVYGGGICGNRSAPTIVKNCAISGNSACWGGGIALIWRDPGYVHDEPTTFANCTISGNSAAKSGGGAYISSADFATLVNDTIAGNKAVRGGGIVSGDSLTLYNTIVGSNVSQSGGDLLGTVSSTSVNNLIGDGAGIIGGISNHHGGNQIGTHAAPIDALLAPLGNYGGPTQTMPLLPGSPAIDAGSNAVKPASLITDQRGLPRMVNGIVDIGAVESQGFTITKVNGDNQCVGLNGPLGSPLVVAVTANNPAEPTAGGQVTFATAGGRVLQSIDADGAASLCSLPSMTVANPCGVTVGAAGVPAGGAVTFQVTINPSITPATVAVPAVAASFPLVINGSGFDLNGSNSVTITDLTNPADAITVDSITVNSTSQLTVRLTGTCADGDVLSAVVTTDGASSAPSPVAAAAPVLTPATTMVPANAVSIALVLAGYGFDPSGSNTVTITDRTRPADLVSVNALVAISANALNVTMSGTFTAGDVLSAVVTSDGTSSAAVPIAIVTPVITLATTFVPAHAAAATLAINGYGFDPMGHNTVSIADLTHPADKVTLNGITAKAPTTLAVTLSGTFGAGDVLAAVVTTNGVRSAATAVATVSHATAITSAASVSFTAGRFGSFTITTTGYPVAALSELGALPVGLAWCDNHNGTATVSGVPVAGSAATIPYRLTIRAKNNGVGAPAVQMFKLFVTAN